MTDEPTVELETTRTQLLGLMLAGSDVLSKLELSGITAWEELGCVGYQPQLRRLEAVVQVKRSTGYQGGLCTAGSPEYVRFFVDWHDGAGFQDVGLTSFRAHDIPDTPPGPQHPLEYLVHLTLDDALHRRLCFAPVLPTVRAVLAWNVVPPLNPGWLPPFGGRRDVDIQIAPRRWFLKDLIAEGLEKKLGAALATLDLEAPLPAAAPKPVPFAALAEEYAKADVPHHRLLYPALAPLLSEDKAANPLAYAPTAVELGDLEIDLGAILGELTKDKPLDDADADTSFERLECVGLNTDTDTLGAVIHVTRPAGYGGTLCQTGTQEHVAFWADWNDDGTFDEYLGTASVAVHDIAPIPAGGLYYGVLLPFDPTKHLRSCKEPQVVRIRAVLSWSSLPSTTDPNALGYWGNRRDVLVQLRPAPRGGGLVELLYDIGNVPIPDISQTTFLAHPSGGLLNPANCSQPAMDRPFAGVVRIGGRIYGSGLPGTVRFQVQAAPHGSGSWTPVTTQQSFELMHPLPWDPFYPEQVVTQIQPSGWFDYLENPLASPPILERTALLAEWQTGALEGLYDLRLAYTLDDPLSSGAVIHYSAVVTITLDNTGFTVSPTANATVDLASTLDLVIDGGDCHAYVKGVDTIHGHPRALDTHFWGWSLSLEPTTHTNGATASPRCRSYASLTDTGDGNAAWSLVTSALDQCGYTLTLSASDRAIVNSNGAIVHSASKAVGFSIQ